MMTMTDHPALESMTPDELRRALAERTDWRLEPTDQKYTWMLWYKGERCFHVFGATIDKAWDGLLKRKTDLGELVVPNWPADPGSALALCLKVCGTVEIDGDTLRNSIIVKSRAHLVAVTVEDGVALALSELALTALRDKARTT